MNFAKWRVMPFAQLDVLPETGPGEKHLLFGLWRTRLRIRRSGAVYFISADLHGRHRVRAPHFILRTCSPWVKFPLTGEAKSFHSSVVRFENPDQ